jgi:hypothetical protein
VMKSKVFVTNLLAVIFLLLVTPIAAALDTPELTWDRGRQQSITLGGNTSSQLWQIKLEGAGKSLKFDQSSKNKDGFIVYTIEIPQDLPVDRYKVLVYSQATDVSTVAYVNISPTIAYDPLGDPKKVGVIAVIAFTLLTFFTGNRSESQSNEQSNEEDQEDDPSALGSVDTAYMGVGATKRGRGDLLRIGRSKLTQQLDLLRHVFVSNTAPRSPLFMRILADSTYLQAISGLLVVIMPLIGIGLGISIGLGTDLNNSLIPTSLGLMIGILILALLDALAGLTAFVTYFLFVLLSGNISSFTDIQSLLGLSLLWFTPALAAGATRPLRRAASEWDIWERVTDILVSTLITAWAIKGMVLAIDGFAKEKTQIATHSDLLAIIGGGLIVIRYLLEEFATRFTPTRLEYLSPTKVKRQDLDAFLLSLFVKALIFILFMIGFFGISWQILAATAILIIPEALKRVSNSFPNIPALFQIIPGGVPAIIVMSFIGTTFSNWANSLPLLASDKSKTIVVLCSLPGFVISLLKLFGRSPKSGDVRWYRRSSMKLLYRFFGPITLLIASLITTGVIA